MFNPFGGGLSLQAVMGGNPLQAAVAPVQGNPFAETSTPITPAVPAVDSSAGQQVPMSPSAAPEQPKFDPPQTGAAAADEMQRMTGGLGQQVIPLTPEPSAGEPALPDPEKVIDQARPIPAAPQVLQNMMMDPDTMRRAEEMRSTMRLAMWESLGTGNLANFLNSEAGKMLHFSIDQFGQAMRENAAKAGWLDPEIETVLKPSNILKTINFINTDQDLALGRIDAAEAGRRRDEMAAMEQSLSSRQLRGLWSAAIATAPAWAQLGQNSAYARQVTGSIEASERQAKLANAEMDFKKMAFDKEFGLNERKFKFEYQRFLDDQDRWEKEFGFRKKTKEEEMRLAAQTAQMNSVKEIAYAQQTINAGISNEAQVLNTRLQATYAEMRKPLAEWQKLLAESGDPVKSKSPDWVDPSTGNAGPSAVRMAELARQIEAYQGDISKINEVLSSPRFTVEGNPLNKTLERLAPALTQQRGGNALPNTADFLYHDPTGTLDKAYRPIVPPQVSQDGTTVKFVSLRPDQMFTENEARALYDYLAQPGVLDDPRVQAVFSNQEAWTRNAAGKFGKNPAIKFANAKLIYGYMKGMQRGLTVEPIVTPVTDPNKTKGQRQGEDFKPGGGATRPDSSGPEIGKPDVSRAGAPLSLPDPTQGRAPAGGI